MSNANQPTTVTTTSTTTVTDTRPSDVSLDGFEDSCLSMTEANEVLDEIWRMTRNPRMLQIEELHRNSDSMDLDIPHMALLLQNPDEALNPSALARTFINNVRSNHAEKLSSGPERTSQAALAVSNSKIETLF